MANFNKTILAGNITRDPELRYVGANNTAVVEVGLAVNHKMKDKEDEVSFFDIVFWSRQAEIIAEFAQKGKSLLIEGRLQQQTWEKDGQKRSKVVVVCENFQFLGGKTPSDSTNESEDKETPPPKPTKNKTGKKGEEATVPF